MAPHGVTWHQSVPPDTTRHHATPCDTTPNPADPAWTADQAHGPGPSTLGDEPELERATKRSVSLPQSLVREIEERAGRTGFSAIVSEALEHWLAMSKLREVVEADQAHGPVSEEARVWAEDTWSASG